MTSERAGGAARDGNDLASAGRGPKPTGMWKPLAEIVSVSIKPETAVRDAMARGGAASSRAQPSAGSYKTGLGIPREQIQYCNGRRFIHGVPAAAPQTQLHTRSTH